MQAHALFRRVVAASVTLGACGAALAHPGHGNVGHVFGQAHALEAVAFGFGLLAAAALAERAVHALRSWLRRGAV